MRSIFFPSLAVAVAVACSACTGPQSSRASREVVYTEGAVASPKPPAERVYDPHSNTYHWERDGIRVSGKYD